MPTIGDLLAISKFNRLAGVDGGSCFGVTDSSRLRPAFRPVESLPLIFCEGCRQPGEHYCEKTLKVKHVTSGDGIVVRVKTIDIPCECPSCNKK